MTLVQLTPEAFQAHIEQAETTFFEQSLPMYQLLIKRGYDTTILGYRVEGDLKISAILYKRRMVGGYHMEIHNGPIVSDPAYLIPFFTALKDYAKRHKALKLSIKPYITRQTYTSNGKPLAEPDDHLITELTTLGYQHLGITKGGATGNFLYLKTLEGLTPETFLSSLTPKGKSLLKKANTFGITLRQLKREELPLFKEITAATSNRREFDDKDLHYYETIFDTFGEKAEFVLASLNFKAYHDKLKLQKQALSETISQLEEKTPNKDSAKYKKQQREFTLQLTSLEERLTEALAFIETYGDQDIPLAASLFLFLDRTAYYLHSGSYPEFNRFYAPALLQEYAMARALKIGNIKTYNLLTVSGEFDGSDGVLRFKQNFNGYIEEKIGSFVYYPKPLQYRFIQLIKKFLKRQ